MVSHSRDSRITLVRDYVQSMRERIKALRPRAEESPVSAFDAAYSEIETAHEELTVADEELRAQAAAIDAIRTRMEDELSHYRALFEDAPDGYVVTDSHGIVLEANRTIAITLGVPSRFLERKPLISFVVRSDCQTFRTSVTRIASTGAAERFIVGLRPRDARPPFVAEVHAVQMPPQGTRPLRIRWSVRFPTREATAQTERDANAKLEGAIARIAAEAAAKGRRLVVARTGDLRVEARAAAAVAAMAESLVATELARDAPESRDLRVVFTREAGTVIVQVEAARATLPIG